MTRCNWYNYTILTTQYRKFYKQYQVLVENEESVKSITLEIKKIKKISFSSSVTGNFLISQ